MKIIVKVLSAILGAIIFGLFGLFFGILWYDSYWTVVFLCTIIGFLLGLFFAIVRENEEEEIKKITEDALEESKRFQLLMESKYGKAAISKNGLQCNCSFSVHEDTEIFVINKHKIPFSNIRACELLVNGQTSTSKTETTAKSSTGNIIGRAVVGSVLAGGTGALIGGLSGKQKSTGLTTTNTITNFSVKISTNNISEPTIIIKCNDDDSFASNLVDALNIIINRISKLNNQNKIVSAQKSKYEEVETVSENEFSPIAAEILHLFELKEKGILTNIEFSQQKKKLLEK